jgi:iron complex outermembrane receptor protein
VPEVAGGFQSEAYGRVVVTASRYGQDPLDSPSSVTILTEDDIRQSGATSIPDLLRQVVGVDVMALSSGKPDVSIRGFNRELSNKVLVLVDGRSVYLDV